MPYSGRATEAEIEQRRIAGRKSAEARAARELEQDPVKYAEHFESKRPAARHLGDLMLVIRDGKPWLTRGGKGSGVPASPWEEELYGMLELEREKVKRLMAELEMLRQDGNH